MSVGLKPAAEKQENEQRLSIYRYKIAWGLRIAHSEDWRLVIFSDVCRHSLPEKSTNVMIVLLVRCRFC